MMENYIHNLLHQLSEVEDSLWRFEQYKKDAAGKCDDCLNQLWPDLERRYREIETLVLEELKKHL